MKIKRDKLWLVGCGKMAEDYANVLNALNIKYKIIGRRKNSAEKFRAKFNKEVFVGGVFKNIKKYGAPKTAIVAVNVENLKQTALELISFGTKRILLEKPGGLNLGEISSLKSLSSKKNAKVFIAYNRRFYSSVIKLKKLCKKGNKISNIFFDFSEWSHIISKLNKPKKVLNHWLIANSSHVIDLAFFLAGKPKQWNFYKKGSLTWHKSGSQFCGSGLTDKGVIFSFNSDWKSPGRWGLDLMTNTCRYILRPIENLKILKKGDIKNEDIKLNNKFDVKYKPGLYQQTKKFIKKQDSDFCTLKQQVENIKIYSKIAGYKI